MKLSLGFSPCPNDTFIFDAMIHQKVDTEGLSFETSFDDVETLNQKAFQSTLDITKLSYHAYAYLTNSYVALDAGSALGFGVGPLLISANTEHQALGLAGLRAEAQNAEKHLQNLKIGIPGKYTTANFLLGLAFPEALNKVEMKFSDIETALLEGKIDLGVIIHENRFTYQDRGLFKIIDLGEYWENLSDAAIPLGGIMIKRELPELVKQKVNRIIRRSVNFALENPNSGYEFIRLHAQEMSKEVIYKHIELYVNKFSVSLGEEGQKAVHTLFEEAYRQGIIPKTNQHLFLQ